MTKIIRCIIVDDEPPAIRLVENYVNKISFLELVSTTTSSLKALQIIENNAIDLVFLDVQMPNLTGIQLSKIIRNKVKIIFTTAYPQFALESYDLNATDYLLKPFEFERFYEAVLKVKNTKGSINEDQKEYVFIKTDRKNNFEKVLINDILYIEGLKNYVAVHLKNNRIITYNTLKNMQEYLPQSDFIKIHKSYIISLRHIEKTSSISVFINDKELPLGKTFKNSFFEHIAKNKI